MTECCEAAAGGGHRRTQSGAGCGALPSTCTPECAALFVPFYGSCAAVVTGLGDQAGFDRLFGQCQAAASQPGPCRDALTWVSDHGLAGCDQYAPGAMTWQPMCAVHFGQYVSPNAGPQVADEASALMASMLFLPVKVTAAEACPVACGACATCQDGKQNGGETGIDCGGSCAGCIQALSCGPVDNSGLIGANMVAICTGQGIGDTCMARPRAGYQPSTPSAVATQCALPGSECYAQANAMLAIPAANVIPGNFRCTANGRWEGQVMLVLPIVPAVCPAQVIGTTSAETATALGRHA